MKIERCDRTQKSCREFVIVWSIYVEASHKRVVFADGRRVTRRSHQIYLFEIFELTTHAQVTSNPRYYSLSRSFYNGCEVLAVIFGVVLVDTNGMYVSHFLHLPSNISREIPTDGL